MHSDAPLKTAELAIEGMSCQGCVQGLTRKLSSVPGVSKATVDLAARKATVEHSDSTATVDDLIAAAEQLGFHAKPLNPPGA